MPVLLARRDTSTGLAGRAFRALPVAAPRLCRLARSSARAGGMGWFEDLFGLNQPEPSQRAQIEPKNDLKVANEPRSDINTARELKTQESRFALARRTTSAGGTTRARPLRLLRLPLPRAVRGPVARLFASRLRSRSLRQPLCLGLAQRPEKILDQGPPRPNLRYWHETQLRGGDDHATETTRIRAARSQGYHQTRRPQVASAASSHAFATRHHLVLPSPARVLPRHPTPLVPTRPWRSRGLPTRPASRAAQATAQH